MNRKRSLHHLTVTWAILILVGLSSCSIQAGHLPTLVPTAQALSKPAPGEPVAFYPSTWTPQPIPMEVANNSLHTLVPTPTPSATPILPTRTPVPSATAEPSETPTPVSYVYRLPSPPQTDELGPSKLGLHVVQNDDPAIMEFVRRAQPAVMKAVGDLGFLEEVRQVSPRTITVGRIMVDHQSYTGSPEEAAQRLVEQQLAQYVANPYVDYWEGWNEPDPNLDRMTWYARFEQERVRLLAQYGLRAAIGGFPAGVPELDEFQLFLPAIETAMEHEGILTLHEGSFTEIDYLYGDPLPGYPAYPDRGSMSFRYRWFYKEILEPAELIIPLVISELAAGADAGWRQHEADWVRMGWGQTGAEAYTNQLAWYDAGVREDGFVIGFAIFTAGGQNGWRNFDVNAILPELASYAIGQR